MDLRTYNLRDAQGYLALATDDPEAAAEFLAEHKDHHADDFTKTEVRQRAKARRELQGASQQAAEELERAEEERQKTIEARADELENDPRALAFAVARLENELVS